MGQALVQRALIGGELAPAFALRADLVRYQTGLRRCRNCVIRPEGGAENRAGTAFIKETKDSSKRSYLASFVFTDDQVYVIEAGDFYFRFYKNGAQIEASPGVPYEIGTPYAVGDLPTLLGHQSGNVVTLTHTSYRPRELTRTGDTAWTLTTITTEPTIAAPSGLSHSGQQSGQENRRYVVTSGKAVTYEESTASAPEAVLACAEPTAALPINVAWPAVAGAVEYYVYCAPHGTATEAAGAYGYIGTTTDLSFNDPGFVPDYGRTPPLARVLFDTAGNYPATSGRYQQRRLFGGTLNDPETIWGSRVGFPSNFSIRSPLRDDDAITWTAANDGFQPVRHLRDLKQLLVLTGRGEFKVRGDGEGGALKPDAINPDRQGWEGSSTVAPIVYAQSVLFLSARGTRIRELRFTQELEGVGSRDLTAFARHLFKRKTITRLAMVQAPEPVAYAVRSDGTLLGLSYAPEHEVIAWHRHDTGAGDAFEDVITVPEGNEDRIYVIVRRTISGVTRRYVERFASRDIDPADASTWWFVDSGVSYSGTPTTTVGGGDHLEGRTVTVLADGQAIGTKVVAGGAITLTTPASDVRYGIPITAQLETLEADVQGVDVRGKSRVIKEVTIVASESVRNFTVGPSETKQRAVRAEAWDSADAYDGAVQTHVPTTWSTSGRLLLQHTAPTPLTVLGFVPNVEVGG